MSFTLEELQKDFHILSQRKDEALQTFHQLVGAVSILEQQINKLSAPAPEPIPEDAPVEPESVSEAEVIEPVEVSD